MVRTALLFLMLGTLAMPSSALALEPVTRTKLNPLGISDIICGTSVGANNQIFIVDVIAANRADERWTVRVTSIDSGGKRVFWRRELGESTTSICRVARDEKGDTYIAFTEAHAKRIDRNATTIWRVSANGKVGRGIRHFVMSSTDLLSFQFDNWGAFLILAEVGRTEKKAGEIRLFRLSLTGQLLQSRVLATRSEQGRGRVTYTYVGLQPLTEHILVYGSLRGSSPIDGIIQVANIISLDRQLKVRGRNSIPEENAVDGMFFSIGASLQRENDAVLVGGFRDWLRVSAAGKTIRQGISLVSVNSGGKVLWQRYVGFETLGSYPRPVFISRLPGQRLAVAATYDTLKAAYGTKAWLGFFDKRGSLQKSWLSRSEKMHVVSVLLISNGQLKVFVKVRGASSEISMITFEPK